MMKVYAVEATVDEEYNDVNMMKVFACRANVKDYIEEHQEMLDI